ncbi:HipA family kinase, partial [Massilia antarctica]|uniref:HipA family kinase n=1 Tax=Massilia antarctica TaxID=2765360 RepID=UPI0035E98083
MQIIEVIDRSEQGITKPFICRGDDGKIYFVKGRGAGRRSLLCEWIAGNLGLSLGLPIAPFTVVDVPGALISLASREDLNELGSGPAFGSLRLQVVELSGPMTFPVKLDIGYAVSFCRPGMRSRAARVV